jgi:hypothetical protein
MDIHSQSRLVPSNQESYQYAPNKPIISRSVTVSSDPAPKRNELMRSSRAAVYVNQPDDQESIYNSIRRRNTSQLDRLGPIIDIYA